MCIGGLFSSKTPIYIHIYYTYFIIPFPIIIWLASMILFLFWFIYWISKQSLYSNKLMWLHITLTVLTSFIILTLPYLSRYANNVVAGPRRYYDNAELNSFKIFGNLTNITLATFAVLLISQLTYFINLFLGLYKGADKLNNR